MDSTSRLTQFIRQTRLGRAKLKEYQSRLKPGIWHIKGPIANLLFSPVPELLNDSKGLGASTLTNRAYRKAILKHWIKYLIPYNYIVVPKGQSSSQTSDHMLIGHQPSGAKLFDTERGKVETFYRSRQSIKQAHEVYNKLKPRIPIVETDFFLVNNRTVERLINGCHLHHASIENQKAVFHDLAERALRGLDNTKADTRSHLPIRLAIK